MSFENGFQVPSRRRSSACKMICFMVAIISAMRFSGCSSHSRYSSKILNRGVDRTGFDLHSALGPELDSNPSDVVLFYEAGCMQITLAYSVLCSHNLYSFVIWCIRWKFLNLSLFFCWLCVVYLCPNPQIKSILTSVKTKSGRKRKGVVWK